jgi:hypothetical protein
VRVFKKSRRSELIVESFYYTLLACLGDLLS